MTLFSRVRRALLVVLCSWGVLAFANPAASDKPYAPVRGQMGKDVMWIPTPKGLIDKMLAAARVTSSDRVYDLGAGDGIIAITAAREFGAHAVGIEYNPRMADYARRMVLEAGVGDKVRIITGDIFKEDFSSATVLTLYLLPELNMQLRPIILRMKPHPRGLACLQHGRLGARRDHEPRHRPRLFVGGARIRRRRMDVDRHGGRTLAAEHAPGVAENRWQPHAKRQQPALAGRQTAGR